MQHKTQNLKILFVTYLSSLSDMLSLKFAYTNPTYQIVLRRELCCQQKPARALFARIFDFRVTNVIRKSFFFFGVRIRSVAIKRPLPDGQERRHKKTTTNCECSQPSRSSQCRRVKSRKLDWFCYLDDVSPLTQKASTVLQNKKVESPMCLITRRRLEVGRQKAVLLDEGVKLCKCCSVHYNQLFSKIIKLSGVSDGVSKCINKNHKTRGALHI